MRRPYVDEFLPPSHDATATFGDPVVGVDRRGNFYYATLAPAPFRSAQA